MVRLRRRISADQQSKGAQKGPQSTRPPQVGISIQDPDDPYRYPGIQGEVVEIAETGAAAHINALAHKHWGRDFHVLTSDQVRVIYKIALVRVWTE